MKHTCNGYIIYNDRLGSIPRILETPYIDKEFAPYKYEIEMIRNKKFDSDMIIKSMYRNIKNKKNKIFDRVVQSDRENPIYEGLSDEEILMKKFADSEYGDGIVTYNEFNEFISFLYPTMSLKDRIYLYVLYVGKLEATPSITKDDKEIDNGYCMRAA